MIIPRFRQLETPRLILRRFRQSDLEALMAYRNDPDVARYQAWVSFSRKEAEDFIARQSRARPGIPGRWFQFAAEIKDSGVLAGDCALLVIRAARGIAEIGYTFSRAYQGAGLATEAARTVIDYGFDSLGLNRVIATTDCRNIRSIALMKRLGMRQEGHFIQNRWFKGSWCDEYQYAVLREEWIAARASRRP
ncbi:MAG: GNAT family protein [Candidatus Binatus sp.]|uniref:GNAT family N-acetyltransferase n=1 Tax=Candidatus Binatus sp. TaxID=2811406 RepID=UPI00271BB4D8|nr:GNAT family protein [Candidatus Binatus sp.]MDO8431914.1 GNAT family protein [Candidatus Binatus sp.]